MSLVSQAIKNLKGGISQQPDILRFDDQGQHQVNAFSSEVGGLQKRPPSVNIARLAGPRELGPLPLCHVIHRDESEQYAVFFTGTGIAVVDLLTGTIQPVRTPQDMTYVSTNKPRRDIRCVTVADYTFVINTKKKVRKGGTLAPQYFDPRKNALVVCNGGQYSRVFRININGVQVASYETPDGSNTGDGAKCDIRYIIHKLRDSFNANKVLVGWEQWADWSCTAADTFLRISAPPSQQIETLAVTDGYNGKLLQGFTNVVARTSDLPIHAPDKYQVEVIGEAGTSQDNFWVQYDASKTTWVEVCSPRKTVDYNASTMPHLLVREADGTFVFKQADWTHRASGDDDTNPYPSFVDHTLSDIFFYRNRLGLLSGENVILSESGAYFNFFPPSVAVSSDSDPIDVAVSTNKIANLKYAVTLAEELVLMSDTNQFVLGSDGILSPTSVRLDLTTEFEVSDNARPYGIGRGVYFVSPRASFSSIRRYYAVQDVTSVKNAEDISAHVPSYIPNGVFSVTGSSTENFLSVLTEGAPHCVFMYKFLYLQEELAQQSWSHWDFGAESRILCCTMIGATMHLILDSPSGIVLERITFTQNTKDFQREPYRLYMDRKLEYTIPAGTYNDDDYKTYIRLDTLYGATPSTGRYYAVLENGTTFFFDPPSGGWPTVDGVLSFDGNLEGAHVFIGEAYNMEYVFSKFLIKATAADGSVSTEDIGRLQLRRAWVNYEKSGNFQIRVDNQGRINVYNMTGQRLGNKDFLLGYHTLDTGQFRYPVGGNAQKLQITMSSDTPNPVAIIGAGWEGNYVRRSSGI